MDDSRKIHELGHLGRQAPLLSQARGHSLFVTVVLTLGSMMLRPLPVRAEDTAPSSGEASAEVARQPTIPADVSELTLTDVISGMDQHQRAFAPESSFELSFEQSSEEFGTDGVSLWTSTLTVTRAKKGGMVRARVRQTIPARNNELVEMDIYWKDGVCSELRGDGLNVMPFLMGQAINYYRYTDSLFIDTYKGLDWGTPKRREDHHGLSPSEEQVLMLPRMISENRSHYRILDPEPVDGSVCVVLDWPERDRIWVDPNHGYLLRKRKLWHEGHVVAEWENSGVSKVRGKVWLPEGIEERQYYGPAMGESQGNLRRISKCSLVEISFDDLPAEYFEVPIDQSRTLVVNDSVRKQVYFKHPAGTDPVEMAMQDARRNQIEPAVGRTQLLFLINAIAIGVIGIFLLLRKVRG